MIIIEQTANSLYKQPERTTATFPSGLVRVDQKYTCSSSSVSSHRATLAVGNSLPDDDSTPAIDGLFIFPHCQESRLAGGFTEFAASAFGRTTDSPTNFISTIQTVFASDASSYKLINFTAEIVVATADVLTLETLNLDSRLLDPFDFFFVNEYNTVQNISVTGSTNLTLTAINAAGQFEDRFYKRRRNFLVTFNMFSVSGVPLGTTESRSFIMNDPTIKIISQTNYGKFTEYKIDVNHNIVTGPTEEIYRFNV